VGNRQVYCCEDSKALPLVLLVKVHWKQGRDFSSEKGSKMGRGLLALCSRWEEDCWHYAADGKRTVGIMQQMGRGLLALCSRWEEDCWHYAADEGILAHGVSLKMKRRTTTIIFKNSVRAAQ